MDKFVSDSVIFEEGVWQGVVHQATVTAIRGREEARKNVPIHTKQLHDAIVLLPVEIFPEPDGFIVRTGVTVGDELGIYPHAMEHGRSPGSAPPPIHAMKEYIEEKVSQGQFDISGYKGSYDQKITAAAIKLSKSIGASGTRAHNFMLAASIQMESELIFRLELMLERHAMKLEGGGL
jgi:hypothetical protein